MTITPFRKFEEGEKERTEPLATIVLPIGMGYLLECKVSEDSSMTVEERCIDRL